MTGLRVLIASANLKDSKEITHYLKQLGCVIVGKATDQGIALRLISVVQPDLVIVEDINSFNQVVSVLTEDKPLPLIIIAQTGYARRASRPFEELPCSYTEKPVSKEQLSLLIKIEIERFHRLSEIRKINNNLNKPNSTRQLVVRASQVIAKISGLDEMQALYQLQVRSFERKVSLRDMAQEVLAVAAGE